VTKLELRRCQGSHPQSAPSEDARDASFQIRETKCATTAGEDIAYMPIQNALEENWKRRLQWAILPPTRRSPGTAPSTLVCSRSLLRALLFSTSVQILTRSERQCPRIHISSLEGRLHLQRKTLPQTTILRNDHVPSEAAKPKSQVIHVLSSGIPFNFNSLLRV